MMVEGDEEMTTVGVMFNKIDEELDIFEKWEKMEMESMDKKGKGKERGKGRTRGYFFSQIKVYVKIFKERNNNEFSKRHDRMADWRSKKEIND